MMNAVKTEIAPRLEMYVWGVAAFSKEIQDLH
jgi:hypothetical protein